MRQRILLTAVLMGTGCLVLADDPKSEPFRFSDDRGGKLLSQMLIPTPPVSHDKFEKKSTGGPASIEQPTVQTVMVTTSIPRLQVKPTVRDDRPGALVENVPFSDYRGLPKVPQPPTFWTADRIRVASADVNQPPPLPILGRPVPDRTSLEDATLDASHIASLAATMPTRTIAAPYLRFTIPNPFETREAIQPKIVLEEDPTPIASTPKLPR